MSEIRFEVIPEFEKNDLAVDKLTLAIRGDYLEDLAIQINGAVKALPFQGRKPEETMHMFKYKGINHSFLLLTRCISRRAKGKTDKEKAVIRGRLDAGVLRFFIFYNLRCRPILFLRSFFDTAKRYAHFFAILECRNSAIGRYNHFYQVVRYFLSVDIFPTTRASDLGAL